MGIDYFLKCVKCYEARSEWEYNEPDDDADWTEYDKTYESFDPEYGLSWGKVNPQRLAKWMNEHKEHGDIEFTAE